LTSATLSSLGSFDRLNRQLGLTKIDNQYLRLPSPFSFEQVDFIMSKVVALEVYAFGKTIQSKNHATLVLLSQVDVFF
jgi:ATP-dependent DNA helicase DinG